MRPLSIEKCDVPELTDASFLFQSLSLPFLQSRATDMAIPT